MRDPLPWSGVVLIPGGLISQPPMSADFYLGLANEKCGRSQDNSPPALSALGFTSSAASVSAVMATVVPACSDTLLPGL